MKTKRMIQRILLLSAGVLLPLLVLELAVRTYAKLRQQDRTLAYDSTLGWKLAPLAKRLFQDEAQPYLIETNSKGLRDREHSYDKSPDIFRIVVLGDSFVFGSGGVSASNRFTDLLEKVSPNLEVINMGVPGYSTDQEYLFLKTEGLKYHPDVVVLCVFVNDFYESFVTLNPSIGRPKGYFSSEGGELLFHRPPVSTFYALSQRSYLLALTERGLRKFWRGQGIRKRARNPGHDEEKIRTFKLLLVGARDLCKANGAEFVLVYFPFKGQQDGNVMRDVLSELASTKEFKTRDLTDFLRQVDAKTPAYFSRDVHFNEYGHRVVANALYDFLVRNTALKRRVMPIGSAILPGQWNKNSRMGQKPPIDH